MTKVTEILEDASKTWSSIKTTLLDQKSYELEEIEPQKLQGLFDYMDNNVKNPYWKISSLNELRIGAFCGILHFSYLTIEVHDRLSEQERLLKSGIKKLDDKDKDEILWNIEFNKE